MQDLKDQYDNMLRDLEVFLSSDKTYKDMTVEHFHHECKLFWKRTDIWKLAIERQLYPKDKLDEDFSRIRLIAKRLLI